MLLDRRRIREEAIDRDQGRDGRKKGEQRIEGHAGRDRHDPIVPELLVDTPQDVLPSARRDLRRRVGFASALFLARAAAGEAGGPALRS